MLKLCDRQAEELWGKLGVSVKSEVDKNPSTLKSRFLEQTIMITKEM